MQSSNNYKTKIVFIGDSGVGKTNIISQFMTGKPSTNEKTTIGADFSIKQVQHDDKIINIQIWDTAGQEKFRAMNKLYYRDANAIIIVFDITRISTFNSLELWLKEIEENINVEMDDIDITIIGNKIDLNDKRTVSHNAINYLKELYNFIYIETSIKDEDKLNEAMNNIISRMISNKKYSETISKLNIEDVKESSYCCGYM
ncbi:Ras family GTPase [Indivirus ILV1]|uniref:Ras family GTPase n=1 Tax=Indivirus ILV1 TaxID=1977633 RepID=A0A1V0SDV3_9VIRU|nr:Ras family GTPase [Indivirus ILV1]